MTHVRLISLLFGFGFAGFTSAAPLRAQTPHPPMCDFFGICGHTVQFKPELYAPVCTRVRDYHPVDWDLAAQTNQLPELPFAKNRVNWEQVYGDWARHQFRTDVCLQFDAIPPDHWRNMESDAAAYVAAFAARLGPSAAKPLVESVEIGNEPGNYSDAQYAALLRTAVPALRRADPKLRLATCNLTTGPSTRYAKSVATLTAAPEALTALDVLTLHTYAEAEPWPTWRRSYPEDPALHYLTDVNDLARWRDQHASDKAIWITEFGYDATTKQPDPKTEFARWVGVTDTQQAQYLVRSLLVFSALPVERAYLYFFNDTDQPMLHSSSGITRNFHPKPAYYALAHFQATLGRYRFSRALVQNKGDCYVYEFTSADDLAARILVAWSPTGGNRSTTTAIPLPSHTRIARSQRMPLTQKAPDDWSVASPDAVPIDESPLYLFLAPAP